MHVHLKASNEERKAQKAEAMAIRRAIVKFFGEQDEQGYTSEQIHKHLLECGFSGIKPRQIVPKMKMMGHVFVKKDGVWFRKRCTECGRLMQLEDRPDYFRIRLELNEFRASGHYHCVGRIRFLKDIYDIEISNLKSLVQYRDEEIKTLKANVERLEWLLYPARGEEAKVRRIILN